jgi:hypothetical protein
VCCGKNSDAPNRKTKSSTERDLAELHAQLDDFLASLNK